MIMKIIVYVVTVYVATINVILVVIRCFIMMAFKCCTIKWS